MSTHQLTHSLTLTISCPHRCPYIYLLFWNPILLAPVLQRTCRTGKHNPWLFHALRMGGKVYDGTDEGNLGLEGGNTEVEVKGVRNVEDVRYGTFYLREHLCISRKSLLQ
jgi:hypothetical protein